MRVICDRRDQDLLFLSQGLLPSFQRMLLSLHLRRCPSCRQRVSDFSGASAALRDALGAKPAVVGPALTLRRVALVAALAILLAAGGYSAFLAFVPAPDAAASGACGTQKKSKNAAQAAAIKKPAIHEGHKDGSSKGMDCCEAAL